MMNVLDKYGIRASAVLNTDVCENYPAIIKEGNNATGSGWDMA